MSVSLGKMMNPHVAPKLCLHLICECGLKYKGFELLTRLEKHLIDAVHLLVLSDLFKK